jgi:hypothetical protein
VQVDVEWGEVGTGEEVTDLCAGWEACDPSGYAVVHNR